VRSGDNFNVQQAAGVRVGRETEGPPLAYHLQVLERVVVRFLDFVCNLLNRFRAIRAAKYLDNLSVCFCGVILNMHSRQNFGVSWDEKRAMLLAEINPQTPPQINE